MGTSFEEKYDTVYNDEKDINSYAKESVKKISAYGIMNGFEDGSFRPDSTVTRAMAAQVIYKIQSLK